MTGTFDEAKHPRDDKGQWTTGSATAEDSIAQADKIAGGYVPLEGLPQKPIQLGNEWYTPGPNAKLQQAAAEYMKSAGLPYDPVHTYQKVDPANATAIADEYEKMKSDPHDPAVKASYDAMIKETNAQWEAIKATGLQVEWIKPGQADPYADSPRRAAMDVSEHNHWWGFPTDLGYGSGDKDQTPHADNPLLKPTGEIIDGRPVLANDVFRIVHDMMGHFKEGNGFRADGEDNAWRSHAAMYSPLARGAMTSETRGQNSWVNFGPYAAANKHASAADTHFAPQKIGLMPEWTREKGRKDPGK